MLSFLTQAPYSHWPGQWHMGGAGFWWFYPILMVVFFVALALFVARNHWHSADYTKSALELLAERFAKGEITKEEFEQKRAVIARD